MGVVDEESLTMNKSCKEKVIGKRSTSDVVDVHRKKESEAIDWIHLVIENQRKQQLGRA